MVGVEGVLQCDVEGRRLVASHDAVQLICVEQWQLQRAIIRHPGLAGVLYNYLAAVVLSRIARKERAMYETITARSALS